MVEKRILIWGTGEKADCAWNDLIKYSHIRIVAFGDNDEKKRENLRNSLKVLSANEIGEDIDLIIIASAAREIIYKQLEYSLKKSIPIYKSVEQYIFKRIFIDITGFCNAKCKYCSTGRANRNGEFIEKKYMSFDFFQKIYNFWSSNEIIIPDTEIMLFNWGEPLLNPDYNKIIEFLADKHQCYSVSTNASVVKYVEQKNAYEKCRSFVISMPRFSQQSYNRIHRFDFEKIKVNIKELVKEIKGKGFRGKPFIAYHVYQFNKNEITLADDFAKSIGAELHPYYAYFNGNSMMTKYLENTMELNVRKEAEEELVLSHVSDLIKQRPKNYRCFLEDVLCVDSYGKLSLCCASDLEDRCFGWGSIFDYTSIDKLREYRKEMINSASCQQCRELGIDYWLENSPNFAEYL